VQNAECRMQSADRCEGMWRRHSKTNAIKCCPCGGIQGLYNAKTESGFAHYFSPADTLWANGTTANYATLSYTDWNSWAKGVNPSPPSTVGVNAVLHLITDDIYLDIKFTSWAAANGGFSYLRSTPTVVPEPAAGLLLPGGLAAVAGVRRLERRNVEAATPR
jgi:hypothetical protein